MDQNGQNLSIVAFCGFEPHRTAGPWSTFAWPTTLSRWLPWDRHLKSLIFGLSRYLDFLVHDNHWVLCATFLSWSKMPQASNTTVQWQKRKECIKRGNVTQEHLDHWVAWSKNTFHDIGIPTVKQINASTESVMHQKGLNMCPQSLQSNDNGHSVNHIVWATLTCGI